MYNRARPAVPGRYPALGCLCILLVWMGLGATTGKAEAPDLVVADFEGQDYGTWKTTGTAFGSGPARGTLPNQMQVDGFLGKGLVNSFFQGDGSTGTLSSPPFTVERAFLKFLIGGGNHPGKTCIELLHDGKVVRSAAGPNDRPGGNERLDWHFWNVGELRGKSVSLVITDQHTGGWGHINVDHIVQTDRPPARSITNANRSFRVEKQFLNLPIRNGAPKRRVSVLVENSTQREFEIELADDHVDWWAFLDLTPFKSKTITVRVDKLSESSRALELLEQNDVIRESENLFQERLRPQLRFSSPRGWLNDPNGLVYHDGEYHLFYQHNPYGWAWGNMHWGHAVSSDLLHWRPLPIALYPRQFGDWAFSGSAVVDQHNTSGWGKKDAPLVLAYTSTGRGECMAYSVDRGRTWTEYEGNPVVRHRGRDPRLFWHEPTRRWCMAVYHETTIEKKEAQTIAFYSSSDLKQWRYESLIDGFFECPDIFELPVLGEKMPAGTKRWVLSAANSDYVIGTFDGKQFSKESGKHRGNYGKGFYAAQTFSDMPDGRRVIIGWLQNPTPGMPFNQMMSLPCELTLRATDQGPRLCYQPVAEVQKLRARAEANSFSTMAMGEHQLRQYTGEFIDVEMEIVPGQARSIILQTRGLAITYDVAAEQLRALDARAPVTLENGKLHLRVIVDRTNVEIYAGKGLVYMPLPFLPEPSERSVKLRLEGGASGPASFRGGVLRSIWPSPQPKS